jgi:hypothetical protein
MTSGTTWPTNSSNWPANDGVDLGVVGTDAVFLVHTDGVVLLASPGDDRCDPDLAYLLAVLVVVIPTARSRFGPPFMARTWEPLITALDQSKAPAACNSGDWNDAGVWQRLHETRSRRPG